MKSFMIALVLISAGMSIAVDAMADCASQAADKKIYGAAKNSFVKKCEKEMKVSTAADQCSSQAAEKKLAGAAKNSFVKKCVKDSAK